MAVSKRIRHKSASSLAREPEITKLILGDKEYELSPMNANMLVEIEDTFDKPIDEVFGTPRIKHVRLLLYLRLRNKYPEIDSEEKLGELLDMEALTKIGKALGVM